MIVPTEFSPATVPMPREPLEENSPLDQPPPLAIEIDENMVVPHRRLVILLPGMPRLVSGGIRKPQGMIPGGIPVPDTRPPQGIVPPGMIQARPRPMMQARSGLALPPGMMPPPGLMPPPGMPLPGMMPPGMAPPGMMPPPGMAPPGMMPGMMSSRPPPPFPRPGLSHMRPPPGHMPFLPGTRPPPVANHLVYPPAPPNQHLTFPPPSRPPHQQRPPRAARSHRPPRPSAEEVAKAYLQAAEKQAGVVSVAQPQIRDLKKEVVQLMPASLKRKHALQKSSGSGHKDMTRLDIASAPIAPDIDVAPVVEDTTQMENIAHSNVAPAPMIESTGHVSAEQKTFSTNLYKVSTTQYLPPVLSAPAVDVQDVDEMDEETLLAMNDSMTSAPSLTLSFQLGLRPK
jgi:hypothetical protein